MVAFTLAPLMVVKDTRPLGFGDGMGGELVKGLTEEFGASSSKVCGTRIPARLGNRSDATVGLQFAGAGIAFALSSKGGDESRL